MALRPRLAAGLPLSAAAYIMPDEPNLAHGGLAAPHLGRYTTFDLDLPQDLPDPFLRSPPRWPSPPRTAANWSRSAFRSTRYRRYWSVHGCRT